MESHSLIGLSPEVKTFMASHRITVIYEAVLTGLIVCSPKKPWSFIENCLHFLARTPYSEWTWDMFVPDHLKPQQKVISETMLYLIFNFEGYLEPSLQSLIKALEFYNTKIAQRYFDRIMQYHLHKFHKRKSLSESEEKAYNYCQKRIMSAHFNYWHDIAAMHKRRRIVACSLIKNVQDQFTCKNILRAWSISTADARKTREYFEKTERGDGAQHEQVTETELKDVISTMEKILAFEIADNGEPIDPDNPPESCYLVFEMFKYLNIAELCLCSRVCRAWRLLTQSRVLWKRLDFTTICHMVNDKVLPRLLKRSRPFLSNLNLMGCNQLGEASFTAISLCKNLQDLNLSQCKCLTDEYVQLISSGCRLILMLNLSQTQISDNSLRFVAKHLKNLQFLNVSRCPNITDLSLEYIAESKGSLTHLNISGCLRFTNRGYVAISAGCKQLQELVLDDLPMLNDTDGIGLIRNISSLRRLSVNNSNGLTDAFYSNLSRFNGMNVLKVKSNPRLTDSGLKYLGQFRDLKQLYLMECSLIQEAFARYMQSCPDVVVLNLSGCPRISDSAIKTICDSAFAPRLRELNINNCSKLSDLSIISVQRRCTFLIHLQMSNLYLVTEQTLESLSHLLRLNSLNITGTNASDQTMIQVGNLNETLRSISVAGCRSVTDIGVQRFAQDNQNLEKLDLSLCGDISDNGIKNLAFYSRLLTDVKLVGLVLLTDLSIQYVSGVCRYLKSLDISGCCLVTDKGIKAFVRAECKLRYIGLLWCPRISKEMAIRLSTLIEVVKHSAEDPPPVLLALASVGVTLHQHRSTSVLPQAPSTAVTQMLEVGSVIQGSSPQAQLQALE